MKKNWTKFTTETGLIGGYRYDKSIQEYRIKLFTPVGRGYYYSCVNEIGQHFDEQILPTLK